MLKKMLLAIFYAIIFLGCTQAPQDPIRIASSPWPGYEPLYLARDLGFFEGKNVNLFELPSSDITMESFRNHSTDLATLTLDETLELIQDDVPLRILFALDISDGGDAVMATPDIKKLSDIKGKRISITNIPLGQYMLSRLLDKAGLQRSDVEVFPMADTHQLDFYKQGKADVVITYDPVKTKLAELGMHVIFDSSDIPNEIFDLLLVHEDIYNKRREELCDIAQQWFRTLDYIKNNKLEASQSISRRLGLKVDQYDEMMTGLIFPGRKENKKLFSGLQPAIVAPAKKLSTIMQANKQLKSNVNISTTLAPDFLNCL